MSSLTPEQVNQLSGVMTELKRLTAPGRIFESARLRLPDTLTEADKTRFRKAFAGAVAAAKIRTYMAVMRNANSERLRLGRNIHDLNETV